MSDYPKLKVCVRCLTPMRASRRKPSDYPFKTLTQRTATLCSTCHRHEQREARKDPAQCPELRPCTDCRRVTRPKNRNASEYAFPTYVRGNANLCARCYDRNRALPSWERPRNDTVDPLADPELSNTMRGYLHYLAGRKQRLAQTGQVRTT